MSGPLELVCPAGTPAALRTAVEAGADTVYVGFADETNARNFPGLNFSRDELAESIRFAHDHGSRVLVAINSFARAGRTELWRRAVDDAVERRADAVIVADIAIAAYMAKHHPQARLHLSVQASASSPEAIDYYVQAFGVKRVVLPRVLTIPEIAALNREIDCETEVFVFGGLCVMAEGRCSLSSYITGKSPNMHGVCSPPSHVTYEDDGFGMISKLAGYTINRFGEDETAGYPTLCKGRFRAGDEVGYVFEEPVSLNAAAMLPELAAAGVTALKIEGRQRGRAYVRKVVQDFRRAVDALKTNAPMPSQDLTGLTEGQSETAGAYRKVWR